MESLVSIIIPVYNSQDYLESCIESVIHQSYQNIEVILVDDGSTDTSPDICRKYAQKDSRIVVIQTEGHGVSAARNTGIRAAKGEWIQFLDSDDTYCNDTTEKMVAAAGDNVQLVVAGYTNVYEEFSRYIGVRTETLDWKGYLSSYVTQREYEDLSNYPWNKLYRTELITQNHIWFDESITVAEDALFNMRYMQFAGRVSVLDINSCNHVIRGDSLVNTPIDFQKYKQTFLWIFKEFQRCFLLRNDDEQTIVGNKLLYYFLIFCARSPKEELRALLKEINTDKYRKYIRSAECINLNYRIFKTLYLLHFNRLLCLYSKLKRK